MMEKATIFWRVIQHNKIRVVHITHKYEKSHLKSNKFTKILKN